MTENQMRFLRWLVSRAADNKYDFAIVQTLSLTANELSRCFDDDFGAMLYDISLSIDLREGGIVQNKRELTAWGVKECGNTLQRLWSFSMTLQHDYRISKVTRPVARRIVSPGIPGDLRHAGSKNTASEPAK